MLLEVIPSQEFDPDREAGGPYWIWLDPHDSGSLAVYADNVIHGCTRAQDRVSFQVDEKPFDCPYQCGFKVDAADVEKVRPIRFR